jgi:RNA polymerase sigma factor (TIGR02999 family)
LEKLLVLHNLRLCAKLKQTKNLDMTNNNPDITRYLHDWRDGKVSALEEMLPFVYNELRLIAKRYRSKERAGHTFQTTDIINEAYLKLVDQNGTDWQNRSHFFAVASRVVRNLLVDYARAKNYQKRGSGAEKVNIDDIALFTPEPNENILALDEALNRLAELDERKGKIVELKYFGGLTSEETADVLGISEITVKREWLKAKAWLYNELSD